MTRPSAAQVQQQAALWAARMDGDSWSAVAEAELEAWLDADPRHDGALLQAQAAWSMLETRDDAGQEGRPHLFSRRWLLAGVGTAVAASIAGGLAIWLPGTRYRTDVGEIRRVPLADGSTVTINTASQIDVDINTTGRHVLLARGEAWFQVARDPSRPFLVEAGPVRVRAIGTAFAVRRREGGADVLVTHGVVEAWSDGAEQQAILITAGQHAFIADGAAAQLRRAEPSSVDRTLAWRNGRIDLVGQPLSEAVAEFNRYNRRQLVIADPALSDEQFDGLFRTDDPAGFANMVHTSLDVPVDMSDPARIAIGRSRE